MKHELSLHVKMGGSVIKKEKGNDCADAKLMNCYLYHGHSIMVHFTVLYLTFPLGSYI